MTFLLLLTLSLPTVAADPGLVESYAAELEALEETVLPAVKERDLEMYYKLQALREQDLRKYAEHMKKLEGRLMMELEREARAQAGELRVAELAMMEAEEAMRAAEQERRGHEVEMMAVEAQLRAQAQAMRAAESAREQTVAYSEIEALAEEMFDLKVALKATQIEMLREKLTRLEAELDDQTTQREVLIEQWLSEHFEQQ